MLYAAYGSNLHPVRLQRRVPSATLLGAACVAGWRLSFHKRGRDGSGKCSIHPADDQHVHVAVFDIAASEKPWLDEIEGVGRGYAHAVIEVPGYGESHTYLGTHLDAGLVPFDWYRELVLAGCRFHRFPRAYVAAVEAIPVTGDHDAERARQNRSILDELAAAG